MQKARSLKDRNIVDWADYSAFDEELNAPQFVQFLHVIEINGIANSFFRKLEKAA